MLMVRTDAAEVERHLLGGALACPDCGGVLRPWGRVAGRRLRLESGEVVCGVRRGRCRLCGRTHVLLPLVALERRLDVIGTIGRALHLHALGTGQRSVARAVGRPEWTVRGWLRRARARAGLIRDHFALLGHERFGCDLGRRPLATPIADALEVIGRVARAAVQQLGPLPLWQFVAGATSGGLLRNTSALFPPAVAGSQAAAHAVITTTTTAVAEEEAAHGRPPP